jgi:hypothetical protein
MPSRIAQGIEWKEVQRSIRHHGQPWLIDLDKHWLKKHGIELLAYFRRGPPGPNLVQIFIDRVLQTSPAGW